jgi:hypothetical protein
VKFHQHNKLTSHFVDLLSPLGKRFRFYIHKRQRDEDIVLCPYFVLYVFRVILIIKADYLAKQQKPVSVCDG